MFYWKSALEFLLKQLYYPPLFSISDSQLDLQSLKYWFLNFIFLIFYWKTAYRLSGCMVLPLFSIEKLDGEFEVSRFLVTIFLGDFPVVGLCTAGIFLPHLSQFQPSWNSCFPPSLLLPPVEWQPTLLPVSYHPPLLPLITVIVDSSLLDQLLIFLNNFSSWALSSDIPAHDGV